MVELKIEIKTQIAHFSDILKAIFTVNGILLQRIYYITLSITSVL
jgi:hypothetical protein